MIEIKDNAPERAILIGVRTHDISKEKLEEHLDELEIPLFLLEKEKRRKLLNLLS